MIFICRFDKKLLKEWDIDSSQLRLTKSRNQHRLFKSDTTVKSKTLYDNLWNTVEKPQKLKQIFKDYNLKVEKDRLKVFKKMKRSGSALIDFGFYDLESVNKQIKKEEKVLIPGD